MHKLWQSDTELFDLVRRELFTAVVGDILDKMGLRKQFLPPQIRPLHPNMILVGRAMPVLGADVFAEGPEDSANRVMSRPFGLMLEALDDLKPGEVYICTGPSPAYALWGELMSMRAMRLGAAGAVLNGYSRDTRGILAINFPTFSYGPYAQDQAPRGKVIDFRSPIEINGVRVNPGDLIFGDLEGVLIVPRAVEVDVLSEAIEKARGEKRVAKALQGGMSAAEAFSQFGIL